MSSERTPTEIADGIMDDIVGTAFTDWRAFEANCQQRNRIAAAIAADRGEREPKTIPDIAAAIGRLQARLQHMVLGDPTISITSTEEPSK